MYQRLGARERSYLRTRRGCPSSGRSHTRARLQRQLAPTELDALIFGGPYFMPICVGDRMMFKSGLASFHFNGICIRMQFIKVDLGKTGQFFTIRVKTQNSRKNRTYLYVSGHHRRSAPHQPPSLRRSLSLSLSFSPLCGFLRLWGTASRHAPFGCVGLLFWVFFCVWGGCAAAVERASREGADVAPSRLALSRGAVHPFGRPARLSRGTLRSLLGARGALGRGEVLGVQWGGNRT